MVSALDAKSELLILPINEYDMANKKAMSYKRAAHGKFVKHKRITPEADLWIVYTDGYWIDTQALGYEKRIDYLDDQFKFHDYFVRSKAVTRLVNSTAAEKTTLKNWFAELDCKKLGVIPTYKLNSKAAAGEVLQRCKKVVAKPNWGGAGINVQKIEDRTQLDQFLKKVAELPNETIKDYCLQQFVDGDEKRLWFLGDRCVGGRTVVDRPKPWSDPNERGDGRLYNSGQQFERDLRKATKLWRMSGLQIGSVDFIGDYINEINGCGTLFTYYNRGWDKVADARPQLIDYLINKLLADV